MILTIDEDSPSGRLSISITGEGLDGRAGSVLSHVLLAAVEQFVDKAADYDSADIFTADLLGAHGQFADMWRKMGKLYKALWKGEELDGEQPDEIVRDFIGHCLLTLHYLNGTDAPPEGEQIELSKPYSRIGDGVSIPSMPPCTCAEDEDGGLNICPRHDS